MGTYSVNVGDATYEVDAPDENTAWKWANATHQQAPQQPAAPVKKNLMTQAKERLPAGNIFSAIGDPFMKTVSGLFLNGVSEISGAISEPLMKMGSGLIAKPVSEIAGLAAMGKDLITGSKEGDPQGFKNYVQQALTYEPKTAVGESEYNPLNAIPQAIGNVISAGANLVADPIAGDEAADTARGMSANAVREAVPQALGFIGAKKLPNVKAKLASDQAKLDLLKAQQKPFRDVVEASRAEGLVMPPSSVNPTKLNKAVESVAGKVATQVEASLKNQPVFNSLGRKAIGVADDVPLTEDVFNSVRAKAGTAYEDLKQVGQFSADKAYTDGIKNIGKQTQSHGNYATLKNPEIDALVSDLKKHNFDSADTVALMKQLRNDANVNLGPTVTDPSKIALGRAQKKAAQELEGLVDRNLAAAEKHFPGHGYGDIAKKFKEARETIAKSYNLQKATDTVTGNVDPRVLGRQLKANKPLTGELKTLAQFGSSFEKASQNMQKAGSPVSATSPIVSTLLASMGYGAAGAPGIMAGMLPLARPVARSGMLSKTGQRLLTQTPNYDLGTLSKLMAYGKPATGVGAPMLADQAEARTLAEQLMMLQQ